MKEVSRRKFLARGSLWVASVPILSCAAEATPSAEQAQQSSAPPSDDPAALEVAMLIYPGMTALDMVGPQLLFASLGNVRVHQIWKDLTPVTCDSGLTIVPTATLADCPAQLDVLFVGGASRATWPLMEDQTVLEFLADRGERARYVTSVCTGSLLLAAAGLLNGYRATGNWATRHLLDRFGATCVDERVVIDRNRITGAGVTAGLDFGLHMSEMLRGRAFAEVQQLMFEYAPAPPFESGSPELASPSVLAQAQQRYAQIVADATEVSERVKHTS